MDYGSGGNINAEDYNSLVNNVKEVYNDLPDNERANDNYGYGRAFPDLSEVEPDKLIEAVEWNNLFLVIRRVAEHQGTKIEDDNIQANIKEGDIIKAYDSLTTVVSDIRKNRLFVPPDAEYDIKPLGSSERTVQWEEQISHEFTLKFDNKNDARYFFNTNGKITISGTLVGGTDNGINLAWKTSLSDVDLVIFNHNSTKSSAGYSASNVGYYRMVDQPNQIVNIAKKSVGVDIIPDSVYYTSDFYIIDTSINSEGTELYFKVYFRSEDDGNPVDGTLTSTVSAYTVTSLRHPSDPELPDVQPIILPTYIKTKGIDEPPVAIP